MNRQYVGCGEHENAEHDKLAMTKKGAVSGFRLIWMYQLGKTLRAVRHR
jgi:hypothetical protein